MSATPTSSSSTPQHWSTPQSHGSPAGSPHPSASGSSATNKSAKALAAGASQTGGASAEKKNGKQRTAINVFSNDGSFLERFQRNKKEEEERRKAEEDVKRKREFDERFKKRGKRPPPDESTSNLADDHPLKRTKGENGVSLTQYEKEVKSYSGRSLKDDGIGVRPLVK